MYRRNLPMIVAACASVAAHLLLWRGSERVKVDPVVAMSDENPRRREATFTIVLGAAESAKPQAAEEPEGATEDEEVFPDQPEAEAPKPEPPPVVTIPPAVMGEATGTGIGSNRIDGTREQHAREAENDQAFLSRDPAGMGRVGDAPSTAIRLPGQGGTGPAAMPTPAPPPAERRPEEAIARNEASRPDVPVPPAKPRLDQEANQTSPRPEVPVLIFSPSVVKPTVPQPRPAAANPAGPARVAPMAAVPAEVAPPPRGMEPGLRLARRGVDVPPDPLADLPRAVRAAGAPAEPPDRASVAIPRFSPLKLPDGRELSLPPAPLAAAPPVLPAAPTPSPSARPADVFQPPPPPQASPDRTATPQLMTNAARAGGDGRLPGAPSPAADPAVESHSESDPFSKLGSADFRDGRLVPRFGRQVKTVRPRLPIVGQVDAFARGGASVTLKVDVDAAGKVTTVAVHKSSGSNEIDQPCLVAMYEWWFEPPKDASGKAVADTLLFTINFR